MMPTYEQCLRPLLGVFERHGSLHMSKATELVADHFKLSPEARQALLPSGRFTVIASRVGWARTFLNKAGLIENERRGVWRLSAAGCEALGRYPTELTVNELRQYPSFVEWCEYCDRKRELREDDAGSDEQEATEAGFSNGLTPDEAMEQLAKQDKNRTKEELLRRLRALEPAEFERLVEKFVIGLGYGSSDEEVRSQLRSGRGDQGVDAVVKQDKLGLDRIYIQAKRYREGAVTGRPDVQAFVGAMDNAVRRGVFITTASFSPEAVEYAESRGERQVRLVDGEQLADLMIELRLGVSIRAAYYQFDIDETFFELESE